MWPKRATYPDELADLNRREMFIMDQRGILIKAEKQGLEKGLAKGLEKGLAQGLAQGASEGRSEERLAIARAMLGKGADPGFISETTGLSLDEIKHLTDQ